MSHGPYSASKVRPCAAEGLPVSIRSADTSGFPRLRPIGELNSTGFALVALQSAKERNRATIVPSFPLPAKPAYFRSDATPFFVQTTPLAVRQTNHMTRDFQDPRLRHSIVMGFVRRYPPGFAQRRRADWPGDSPCPL